MTVAADRGDDAESSTAPTRLRRTLEGVIGVPATEGNRIDILRNGDAIFPAMLDAIEHAQHTIDFLTFVYWRGEIGTRFAQKLAAPAAQQAGVTAARNAAADPHGAISIDRAAVRESLL